MFIRLNIYSINMVQVEVFTKGKIKNRNEDYTAHNDTSFVIVDGATDKSGNRYNGKTGGELVAKLVSKSCLESDLNGVDLVDFLNSKVKDLYDKLGILNKIQDPINRFTCDFILVRKNNDKIIVTYLGNLGFRINGKEDYQETKLIDKLTSEERSRYIKETGDIKGSREHIMPLLLKQFEYQNSDNHKLGYGVIDGTKTPHKFVEVFEYKKDDVKIIELFSDGYFDIPKGTTIKDWEDTHNKIEELDSDKYLKYKSTKSKDDRTIMIIRFE